MKEIDTLSFILFLGLLFMFGAAMFLACENARLRTQLAQAKVIVVMPNCPEPVAMGGLQVTPSSETETE